jgi:hypothetical protein
MKGVLYTIIGIASLPFLLAIQIGIWVGEMFKPITELGKDITKQITERMRRK